MTTRRSFKRRSTLWGVTVGLGLCSALAAAMPASAATTAPESASITVPTQASSAAIGYEVYANTGGFFQKYGLTVSTPISDSGTVLSEFVAGAVQIDNIGALQAANLYEQGYPTEVVACTNSRTNGFFVYAQKNITSVKDLIGKRFAVTALGSIYQLDIELWLQGYGIKPSQVTWVPLGSIPNVYAGLASGSVDAGGLSYPVWGQAASNQNLHRLGVTGSSISPIVANASWAKHNKNTIIAFLKGEIEGLYGFYQNESTALPVLAQILNLNLSNPTQNATAVQGFETYKPPSTLPLQPCPSTYLSKGVLPYVTASQRSLIKKNAHGKFLNNTYINAIVKQGFYQKLQKKYGKLPGFTPPSTVS